MGIEFGIDTWMEDNLLWKMTFNGRLTSKEGKMDDDHQLKKTSYARRPSMEDDLQLKMTFNGR